MDWLFASLDPSRPHDVGWAVSWHARTMVFAWGILSPLAILTARFLKVLPWQNWPQELDNKLWWHCHWIGHSAVIVLSLVGLLLVCGDSLIAPGLHGVMGYLLLSMAAFQVLSGILRGSKGGPTATAPDGSPRGDHYDMTPRRLAFEMMHKTVGYTVLVLTVVVIVQGLWLANAPRWMALTLSVWWVGWTSLYIQLQRNGWAVDTYQAIWGPGTEHPGNRRKSQGWGMVRPRLKDRQKG